MSGVLSANKAMPFVFQQVDAGRDAAGTTSIAGQPDLRYLHTFNDAGGRPEERHGTRGSFTPGVRIMSGGQSHDVTLGAEIDHGKVLFTSSTLKPDLSGEARTNATGGRPTERLGTRGSFAPGVKSFLGGPPRDVPLEAEVDHGKVLFVSSTLKPDLSGEARTNAVRPTERLGTHGRFTPGVRLMSGGVRRDVPLGAEIDHGKVLFVSATLKPDLSGMARTNAVGGRPTERLGTRGGFTPGSTTFLGGAPRDVPLEVNINPGTILFKSSTLKPDLSAEARTNAVRPTERLGTGGRFTPGARRWLGGQPRDVPAERELDHGTILFPRPSARPLAYPLFGESAASEDDYGGFVETETVEGCHPYDVIPGEDREAFDNSNVTMVKENSGVFRRCGSDSEFAAGPSELLSAGRRPAF